MAIARCRVCDTSVGETDRFCASCGAPLTGHVTVVDLGKPSLPPEEERPRGAPSGWVIALVVISLAIVALAASLSIGSRDRSPPSQGAAGEEAGEPPAGDPARVAPPETTRPSSATAEPGADREVSEPVAPTSPDVVPTALDVSTLPAEVGATHLAVRGARGVTFIDLSTGEQRHVNHAFGAVAPTIRAVPGGVVTVAPDGLVLFRSDGTKEILFARRALRLVGTRDDIVVVLDPVDVTSLGPTVRGVTMDGRVEWSIALPASVQATDVVDDRTIAVDAASTIMLLQPGAPPRLLFSGRIVAVGPHHVIGYWCDAGLVCATRVLDLATGGAAIIGDEETFFDPDTWRVSPDGSTLAGLTFGMGGRRLTRVDVDTGMAHVIGADRERVAHGEVVAWDPSGSYVLTRGETLAFVHIESGARHPLDLGAVCCGDDQVVALVG